MPVLILNPNALGSQPLNTQSVCTDLVGLAPGPRLTQQVRPFWKIPEYGPRQPGPLLRSRGGIPLLAGQGLVHLLSCLPITHPILSRALPP